MSTNTQNISTNSDNLQSVIPKPYCYSTALTSSIGSGYLTALCLTPLKVGARTGLSRWAIPHILKTTPGLITMPIYRNLTDKTITNPLLSVTTPAVMSGITEAGCHCAFKGNRAFFTSPKKIGLKLKIKNVLVFSHKKIPHKYKSFPSLAVQRSAFYFSLFTVAPFIDSFLHKKQESTSSSFLKCMVAGSSSGAIGHYLSYPLKKSTRVNWPFLTAEKFLKLYKGANKVGKSPIVYTAFLYTFMKAISIFKKQVKKNWNA